MQTITISKDFTDRPGARYYSDGPFSGEQFYERNLRPKFQEIMDPDYSGKRIITIDFDDTYGYPSSFVSEAFGRLYRDFGEEEIWDHLEFVSEDDRFLPDLIRKRARAYVGKK